jgi:hypothetical protein
LKKLPRLICETMSWGDCKLYSNACKQNEGELCDAYGLCTCTNVVGASPTCVATLCKRVHGS